MIIFLIYEGYMYLGEFLLKCILVFTSLGFFIVGLNFFLSGIYNFLFGILSTNWPIANGEVLESKLIESKKQPEQFSHVKIKYTYSVSEVLFKGSTIGFAILGSRWNNNHKRAKFLGEKYHLGKKIAVHFWPRWHRYF